VDVGFDGLHLLAPEDKAAWQRRAAQYRFQPDWNPANGGSRRAGFKNSIGKSPLTWLACKVAAGTEESARELVRRRMRAHVHLGALLRSIQIRPRPVEPQRDGDAHLLHPILCCRERDPVHGDDGALGAHISFHLERVQFVCGRRRRCERLVLPLSSLGRGRTAEVHGRGPVPGQTLFNQTDESCLRLTRNNLQLH
jgi:hypothetical protein